MLKENTVITLHPEEIYRLQAILLDEDRSHFKASLSVILNTVKDLNEILAALRMTIQGNLRVF